MTKIETKPNTYESGFEDGMSEMQQASNEAVSSLEAINAEIVAALEEFTNNAHEKDVGGGDVVFTTSLSLEMARKALAKAKSKG